MLNMRRKTRRLFFAAENFAGDTNRIRAGYAHERDRAFARRRGNRGNSVRGRHINVNCRATTSVAKFGCAAFRPRFPGAY